MPLDAGPHGVVAGIGPLDVLDIVVDVSPPPPAEVPDAPPLPVSVVEVVVTGPPVSPPPEVVAASRLEVRPPEPPSSN
jgi:hypothetical protein